ncbi:hypothetical protein AURANDRAFT_14587, partial [Aureococcus anophagefferens]
YSGTSSSLAVASGRLSYVLGLTGPNLPIDTACSASLVSLHVAGLFLIDDVMSHAAVAGSLLLLSKVSIAFALGGMISPRGRSHTFDVRADGFCRGEGFGAFLVTTEDSFTSVRSSSVQQDGPSASLTAPSGSSQKRLIE